ncbi:MAG: CinA family nicotinamide mononucleotide deamidase-related protein [Deltaproteobacteria bacterium]|nr:CinA family nicotinamide mononucleotide deamidase-related protein [Deltaproteobacteria bacterium]
MSLIRIAVMATGSELLNGSSSDTNTRDIARLLGEVGYRLTTSVCVGDDPDAIARSLRQLLTDYDVIICTGGLGSTGDDLTAKTVALALGRALEENPKAVEMIAQNCKERQRDFDAPLRRQAQMPQKSVPLVNQVGTAPGFWLRQQNCDLFFLPGVPAEMRPMMQNAVIPALQRTKPGGAPLKQRNFKFFGLSEPQLEARVPYKDLPPGIDVGFSLDYPLVKITLRCQSPLAATLLDDAQALLLDKLGDYLAETDEETMPALVGRLLKRAGLRLSLAESCTGGLLSHLLTSVAGSSDFFERAGITYADAAKIDWLGVPRDIIAQQGAVSAECATAMAQGLRAVTGTDLTLAITGIAGPGGGSLDKPVGTVFLALAAEDLCQVRGYQFHGDRQKIQRMSAFMAMEWLRRFALEAG